jgi:hypothetical protein
MQALRLLLLTLMAPVASASTSFQPLDRVEGWLIERRLDANQDPICRASVPGPGTTRASAKRGGFFLIDPEQHLSILCSANVLRL